VASVVVLFVSGSNVVDKEDKFFSVLPKFAATTSWTDSSFSQHSLAVGFTTGRVGRAGNTSNVDVCGTTDGLL